MYISKWQNEFEETVCEEKDSRRQFTVAGVSEWQKRDSKCERSSGKEGYHFVEVVHLADV